MGFKFGIFVVLLVIATTTARPRKIIRQPCSAPRMPACISPMVTPYPTVIETIDYGCGCQMSRCNACNDQLILPPMAPELPFGLGYMRGALPVVADYYEPGLDYLTTGAYIPVARDCGCLTLAAPVCPDYAALVKPIVL